MDGRFYHHTVDHGPYLLGWLTFAVLLALLVVGILALLGRTGRPHSIVPAARSDTGDALTILRLRYARGEISRDGFVQASEDLGAPPPARA